ncbi:MAG: hypothetical protein A2X54_03085 [Nitrospirae bacterium GWF2_44_13]|nr:MAG: hypothetical protein A2X54_03085 [Nitrospirae bacterium GWF2_44_13]OGW34975.1 MAG: hypothetical protein A2088_06625 [Nitrospirae bacterium GWD2_44_7]OGW65023.1 MAG: hypothetical protein A2222_05015 [Nitrospirae bacterium RIFOXYA2_FULL_44_9]
MLKTDSPDKQNQIRIEMFMGFRQIEASIIFVRETMIRKNTFILWKYTQIMKHFIGGMYYITIKPVVSICINHFRGYLFAAKSRGKILHNGRF